MSCISQFMAQSLVRRLVHPFQSGMGKRIDISFGDSQCLAIRDEQDPKPIVER